MTISTAQKKISAFVLLIACFNLFTGCHRYYRPVKLNTPTVERKQLSLNGLTDENRYFILRKGIQSFALSNIVLDQPKMTLSANLSAVPPEHQLYIQNKNYSYKYSKSKDQQVVLEEVHIFVTDAAAVDTSKQLVLSLSDVERIEVIEFDKRHTSSSYTWGAVGITLGAALVIVAIAALATPPTPEPAPVVIGSCPYISAYNGGKYSLQGEIYSAAIYPSLQKEDYLPLQIEPLKGTWCIKISNDLKEIQHTDFADLVIAEHSKDVQLLIDPQGNIHSVSQPQLPLAAMLNNRRDLRDELKDKDTRGCLFQDGDGTDNQEDLYLTFKNDNRMTKGKLILNARSSSWFNYLYNEFTKGFGSYYNKWVKQEEKKPAGELEKWADEQHIPLTISVKTSNGWKEINKLKTIGPLLNREVAIPLDIPAGDQVEVKITGGYMFWELDYAAIDYTENANFTVREIKPYEAINEKGIDVLPELTFADKKFMVQPNTGDATILKYKSIEAKTGMAQTFFFHTSGYYDHPRNPAGMPKVAFLKSFEKPGAMSAYSKQKFLEAWNSLAYR